MFPHGETVTRLRGTPIVNPYSGLPDGTDWEDPDEDPTDGWGVDDSRSVEPLQDARNAVVTDYVLYRPEPADILPGDRVIVRGVTCEVVGRPAWWHHPMTGWDAGFVVRADAVEG